MLQSRPITTIDDGTGIGDTNVDAVRDVQHEVKRVEQRLLLDSVR